MGAEPVTFRSRTLYQLSYNGLSSVYGNFWWTGEDSNLRSSKERQVYSLLPLTARPPVRVIHPHRSHQSEITLRGNYQHTSIRAGGATAVAELKAFTVG